jgi:hypothetical protein
MRIYKVRCEETSKTYVGFDQRHMNKSKDPLLTLSQAKIVKVLHDIDYGDDVAVIENVWLQEHRLFIACGVFGLVLIVLAVLIARMLGV